VTVLDAVDRAASARLLDAFARGDELSGVLVEHAIELGEMLWRDRSGRLAAGRFTVGVRVSDVAVVRRWLQDEWVDCLLLRLRGRSAALRLSAGRLLDDVETVDALDLPGIAGFLYWLYTAADRSAVLARRYEALT
jgi:hypothetical protein